MEAMLSLIDMKYVPNWLIGCLLSALFFRHYIRNAVRVPTLICSNKLFRKFLHNHVPVIQEKFWPAAWCFESRMQTVMASVFRALFYPSVQYIREIVKMKDGGIVALDWLEDGCPRDAPVILILPGLTGCSTSEYVRIIAKSANEIKLKVVVFNNRGLGGVSLKTSRLYCAADFEDLVEILDYIRAKRPGIRMGAVGVSMGGLILGNYLASMQENAGKILEAAMLVSVPWDTIKGSQSIEKPVLNLMLNRYLAHSLCQNITRIKNFLSHDFWDYNDVMQSRTIREFDSKFTIHQFGFKHVDDYYAKATLRKKFQLMRIPVLCLAAEDDPFQPYEAIPLEDIASSSSVAMMITARGGHIGFMEGLFPAFQQPYIGRVFSQYFTAVFNYGISCNE